MGMIRIIGGIHRSRILQVIDADGLRPTSNRVRETLFNWLGQDLSGKKCLDLFAGSGALGFEAISRNAKSVVMIEKDSAVYNQLQKNMNILKIENLTIIRGESLHYLMNANDKFDVIFVDPPYSSELMSQALAMVSKYLTNNGVIFIEYKNFPELTDYEILKSAKYGMVNFALIKPKENK